MQWLSICIAFNIYFSFDVHSHCYLKISINFYQTVLLVAHQLCWIRITQYTYGIASCLPRAVRYAQQLDYQIQSNKLAKSNDVNPLLFRSYTFTCKGFYDSIVYHLFHQVYVLFGITEIVCHWISGCYIKNRQTIITKFICSIYKVNCKKYTLL